MTPPAEKKDHLIQQKLPFTSALFQIQSRFTKLICLFASITCFVVNLVKFLTIRLQHNILRSSFLDDYILLFPQSRFYILIFKKKNFTVYTELVT
jgi:hypothetical protein